MGANSSSTCNLCGLKYQQGRAHLACVGLLLQVSTVLQPLVTNDPPPTYFKTDMFTSCFQVSKKLPTPDRRIGCKQFGCGTCQV